jgi:hypothetical protein
MNQPSWRSLQLETAKIPAKPEALWTLVHQYVHGPCKLKLSAKGKWKYSSARECGPDGYREAGVSSDALNSTALLGALIGKIGGSPAEKPGTDAFTFVAGSYVVLAVDKDTEGGLYLTMNDQPDHFDEHSEEIEVTIEEARSGSG